MASLPALEIERVSQVLNSLWGRSGQLQRLSGYEDENFEVRGPDGHFVFRVSQPQLRPEDLLPQNAAMRAACDALRAADAGRAPRPISSLSGEELEAWPDDPRRSCRLLSWVEGRLWAHARPVGLETHASLGRFLAQLDLALLPLEGRPSPANFDWDLRNAGRVVGENLQEVVDPTRRELVQAHLQHFTQELAPHLDSLPHALVHNDANDYNLLVAEDGEGGLAVSGVIDFGDAYRTARVFELAIAAAYAIQREHDPLRCLHALVRAYLALHPLSEREQSQLPAWVAMRLCTSVVLAAKHQRLDPTNAYLQISAAPAWRALEQLEAAGRSLVSRVVSRAANNEGFPDQEREDQDASLLAARQATLSESLSLSYDQPLHIVRGRGAYLFDAGGRAFLDGVNNVCHVGHAHWRVVAAGARQAAALNTNTRYLHPAVVSYAQRLLATLPSSLEVLFLVCSGSEANDLAVRMARTVTGRKPVYVLDHAYHGNTSALIELSPYKFDGRGGQGPGTDTRVLAMPDPLRPLLDVAPDASAQVQAHTDRFAARLKRESAPALFMSESLLGCGGQVELPQGYLRAMFEQARVAGALCLADEVQVGFGRVGTHFWGFETQGVVPDIVTMGKPIGNGHPIAAVATTREVAQAFDTGMEYFNTFGGNPVSACVGAAVLDVIEDEGLQTHARDVGAALKAALARYMHEDPGVADVRGRGLFLGVELVHPDGGARPDAQRAQAVVEHALHGGVLLSRDGPKHNVLKIKPPLVIGAADAERLATVIGAALRATRG